MAQAYWREWCVKLNGVAVFYFQLYASRDELSDVRDAYRTSQHRDDRRAYSVGFADSLVLLITWRRTWPVSVDAARSTVSSVLMTDGELSHFADTLQSD